MALADYLDFSRVYDQAPFFWDILVLAAILGMLFSQLAHRAHIDRRVGALMGFVIAFFLARRLRSGGGNMGSLWPLLIIALAIVGAVLAYRQFGGAARAEGEARGFGWGSLLLAGILGLVLMSIIGAQGGPLGRVIGILTFAALIALIVGAIGFVGHIRTNAMQQNQNAPANANQNNQQLEAMMTAFLQNLQQQLQQGGIQLQMPGYPPVLQNLGPQALNHAQQLQQVAQQLAAGGGLQPQHQQIIQQAHNFYNAILPHI